MKKTLIFFALLLGALQPAGAQCCRDQVKQQCKKTVCDSAAVCKAAHRQQGNCANMQACVKDQQCDKSKACVKAQQCDKSKACTNGQQCDKSKACTSGQQCDKSKACASGQHCDKLKAKNLRSSALKTRAKAQLSGKSKKQ